MGKPRLPWKRGPVAWKVACRAEEIREALAQSARRFFSLRRTAAVLGISTQPLRNWVRRGYLQPDGPRGQISKGELQRFMAWLEHRAEPFDTETYVRRFYLGDRWAVLPFARLDRARFAWPANREALTPAEIARLVPCHPSLIVKAIRRGEVRGRRRSRCRWEVTRRAWRWRFALSGT